MVREPHHPTPSPLIPGGLLSRWLEAVALLILILIIAIRPLLSETYTSELHSIGRAVGKGGESSPALTAWFDLGIWTAALLAAIAAMMRRRWITSGIELGWLMMTGAAVASTFAASNKRLAINASCDWLTTLAMIMILVNLCRGRFRVGLILAVLVASGVASATKCATQLAWEFDDTREMYYQNKSEFWQAQGVALDDPQVDLFERRMEAREASGFFPFSNVTGAWLAMAGFAAVSAVGRAAGRDRRTILGTLAAMLFAAIFTTGSKGAIVSATIGLGLCLMLCHWRKSICRRPVTIMVLAWGFVLAAVLAIVGYGVVRNGLPGDSLRFRWNYWQVSRTIIEESPWTGVGARNFDHAYLQNKPASYPEEIQDPHNLIVAIISQWGIPGGIGLALILAGGSLRAAKSVFPPGTQNGDQASRKLDTPRPELLYAKQKTALHDNDFGVYSWFLAIILGFMILRFCTQFRSVFDTDEGWAVLQMDVILCWLPWVGTFCLVGLFIKGGEEPSRCWRVACLAGAAAFLLHNTIGFAAFFPGAITPFVAMLAVMFAPPKDDQENRISAPHEEKRFSGSSWITSRWIPGLAAMLAVVGFGLTLLLMVVPVTRTSKRLQAARDSAELAMKQQHAFESATTAYHAAMVADRLDPVPAIDLASLLARTGRPGHFRRAIAFLDEAEKRDTQNIGVQRLKRAISQAWYKRSGDPNHLMAGIRAAKRAVTLYPQSPDDNLALANLLARAVFDDVDISDDPPFANMKRAAVMYYRLAIRYNEVRPRHELRRWTAQKSLEVRQQLERVEQAGASSPAAPRTSSQPR